MSTPTDADAWFSRMCAGSDMGALVQAFDWSATSLGTPSSWSIGLRTAISVCLSSRFPMMVLWGSDLVEVYNDGFRAMLGTDKHTSTLGSPAQEAWPEIWDVVGPQFADVLATARPTWVEHQQLVVERNGFPEECYFTYSFSPLYDDEEAARGVLVIATETTEQVRARRHLVCLTKLSAALCEAEQVTDVFVTAAMSLATTTDVPSADFYLRVGNELVLVSSNRRDGVSPIDRGLLLQVALDRAPMIIGGNADGTIPAEQFVAPIGSPDNLVEGAFVATLSARQPFDDAYASFLQLIANSVGATLDSAFRRAIQIGEYRLISDTLQKAMLKPASDLPTVAARYLPAVGNLAVGGDWYDVIDLGADGRAIVVGDCVGHGLAAAAVMAHLRSAARSMLLEGHDPAATLEGLDRYAASVDGAYCATVAVAVIDRQHDLLTYSTAGHPPPLIVDAEGTTWLDRAAGVPLAVDISQRRHNATHQLHDDDMIVMYSDGLIERRGENLDVGLARLASAAIALYGTRVQVFADGLLRYLQPENTRDDVVLVVKHLPAFRPYPLPSPV